MNTRQRLLICVSLGLTPLIPISARLALLQIVRHEDLSSRVETSTVRESIEILPRGRILDRKGRVLAESLPSWSAFLDLKTFRESNRPSSERLRSIETALELEKGSLDALLKTKRRTAWIMRKMSRTEAERLKGLGLRSVGLAPDETRRYPNGMLARPMIGSVNAQERGSAGLEFSFDKQISGRAVRWRLTRDGAGRAILENPERAVAHPPDLRLTIDRTMQFFAERSLERTVERVQAARGIVLVQDPGTGEILAMAEYPPDPMHNSAVQDVYEPGSTFKIVAAAAAIETELLKPGETVDCEYGKWQLRPGNSIRDHEPLGALTLAQIIRYSSNIGTAKIGLRLGAKVLSRYSRLFGFGYKSGVPLPAESAGIVRAADDIGEVRLTRISFGQAISVTPLQLIGAFSAIANGGSLMEPRVVRGLGDGGARGPVVVRRVITRRTAELLRGMLEGVVSDGTGASAGIPGYRVAGKTGTAQKFDPEAGGYSTTDYIASFAGFVPSRNPRFSLLVILDSPRGGHYGSQVAGPLFAEIARDLLALEGVPPDLPMPLRLSPGAEQAAAAPPARRRAPQEPAPMGGEMRPA